MRTFTGPSTYSGPTPAQRRDQALAVLREHDGHLSANEIARRIGCGRRQLTGDTAGTLLLLDAEGLVGRVGRKRGTLWFAIR